MNMNQGPSFINLESTYTLDTSPLMVINNLHLELRRLPKGESAEVGRKRELHAELVTLLNRTFTGEALENALAIARQDLANSLTPTE